MAAKKSYRVSGAFLMTSRFALTWFLCFIPTSVVSKDLLGIDLINWRCLLARLKTSGTAIFDKGIWAVNPCKSGYDVTRFKSSSDKHPTKILFLATPSLSSITCHGSTNASGIITFTGTCINLILWVFPPTFYASFSTFCMFKCILFSLDFTLNELYVEIPYALILFSETSSSMVWNASYSRSKKIGRAHVWTPVTL